MKKISLYLLAGYMAFVFSGCASVLNSKSQKVSVYTNNPNAKVYVDGSLAGQGKVKEVRLKRDLQVRQFKVEAEGYKPTYKVDFQKKKSPLYAVSWIPFAIVFLMPPLLDNGPKSWNYDKEVTIKPETKISKKEANQKYIYLKNTSFDLKKEDLVVETFSHARYTKNKKSKDVQTSEKEIAIDNSIFTSTLNSVLKEYGFMDTTNTVFRSNTNTMYINAKVSKVTFKRVTAPLSVYNAYCIAEATVEWDLLDIYEQSKFKKTITTKSGEFASNYSSRETDNSFVVNAMEDAISMSFLQFLEDASVKKLIELEKGKREAVAKLKMKRNGTAAASIKNARSATVTLVTKKGHGSGCIISDEGYIVTNYHVVAGETEVEVITNDGQKHKATFVRANNEADLALLLIKGETTKFPYFSLPAADNFEVGDDVFAIGTPKSLELSQTLSKGIISGHRKLPNNTYWIQTDVAINAGNSGGALVNKNGELVGVINSKLVGFGIEGISFCIPAVEVNQHLDLE